MPRKTRVDTLDAPETAVPGQPGPMAPPDHPEPHEVEAEVGLTQGEAAEADENGEADFVTSTGDTLENERTPMRPEDKR